MLKKLIMITLLISLIVSISSANVPQLINYQGWLIDDKGKPLNETVTIKFSIYDSESDGVELWFETQSVTVADGVFSVLLGSVTPIQYSVFNGDDKYLALKVGNDSEMVPRKRLVSVGYSFHANNSDKLGGKDDSGFVQSLEGVSPDTNGDIDLVEGSNVTITPDAANNQVTISAAAGAGGDDDWIISGDDMYSTVPGKVGIGTTSPALGLHVRRISGYPATFGVEWQQAVIGGEPAKAWFYYAVGGIQILQGGVNMVRRSQSTLRFSTQDEIQSGTITEQMRLNHSGNLGIGTTSPVHRLHISNTDGTNGGVARFANNLGTILDIGVSGDNVSWIVGKDKPYIFTENRDLVIFTGTGVLKTQGIYAEGADIIAGDGGGILVSGGGKIDLMNEDGDGPIISLDPTQNNTKITTPILEITGGGDVAEPFDFVGPETIKSGMVVTIDAEHPGQLRIADKAYDRSVAGIVSGANGIHPGLTMSQDGTVIDGSLPVALTGRVYAWADASYGQIEPGDLLTTSDTPGYAMKVTDHEKANGAVLGKAMSSLQNGKGLVLVLVSLQ